MRQQAKVRRAALGALSLVIGGAALVVLGGGADPAGGTAVSHSLFPEPSGFTFLPTTLGDVRVVAVLIRNTSTTTVDTVFGSITTGDAFNDFGTFPGSDCSLDAGQNVVLGPQAACHIDVFFAPGSLGARQGTITFVDSANSGLSIGVVGNGVIGYYIATATGGVAHFGDAMFFGDASSLQLNHPIVGIAQTGDDGGYWMVASDGGIFSYGDAQFYGSTGAIHLNKPIVGMAQTTDGKGYWLVASDGGIFAYGDAQFFGSTGAIHLNQPIVGMAPTPDGGGYWLVASDGGIFAYGDAQFFGSTGAIRLNKPIVGMAPTPDSGGYWLVASDGGIFSYGDAQFYGSTGAIHLNQPIVGMAAMPTGDGYWFTAADGGVFNYGDAPFLGSAATQGISQVVGIATDGLPTVQAITDSPALRRAWTAHGSAGWTVIPPGAHVEGP